MQLLYDFTAITKELMELYSIIIIIIPGSTVFVRTLAATHREVS